MVDNNQVRSLQVPADLTDIIKVEVRGEALRNFLVQLANQINTQAQTLATLEKRIKALEDGNT